MNNYLVVFFSSFLSTLGVSYVYCKSCDVFFKFNIKNVFAFIIIVFSFSVIKFLDYNFIGSFAYFLFYPFFFYILNPMPFKKLFFYLIIVWFYGMCLDLIAMLIISFIIFAFKLDFSYHWLAEIMTIFVFICMIVIGKSKKMKKITNAILHILNKIHFPDFILTLFTLFVFLMGYTLFANINHLSISLVLAFLIILILMNFVFLIQYKINSVETIKFTNVLKENNKFYMQVDDENRIFKHNLLAKLLSIKSVSNKKARLLIDDLILEFNSNVDFSNHIKDIPYGLNGVLYQKIYSYLNDLDIKIDNQIDYDIFEVLTPRRYNVLVEKMIVSLDNALEASSKSVEKLLIVDLYEQDHDIIIEIKNTFLDNINLDDLGTLNYSTKRTKGGLGLFSALRNKEVGLTVKIVNNLFVSKLIAKKNK